VNCITLLLEGIMHCISLVILMHYFVMMRRRLGTPQVLNRISVCEFLERLDVEVLMYQLFR